MGDIRFDAHYERVRSAADPMQELLDMTDADVVEALAAASRRNDPYLANILATEATNRMQRARSEVHNLGEGLCSLDLEGHILTANPAAEVLLGRSQAELRGQDFDSLCRDGDVDGGERATHGAFFQSLKGGLVVECESERFFRRDGTAFDVSYTAAPIVRNEQIEGAIIAFRDVSATRVESRLLRDSEAKYRSLFENSPDFMFSTDMEGRVTGVGGAAATMTGFEPDEICGDLFERFVAPEDVAAARALFVEARAGSSARKPICLLRKDAGCIATSLLAMPIILEGEIVGAYGLAEHRRERDIARFQPDVVAREIHEQVMRLREERFNDL